MDPPALDFTNERSIFNLIYNEAARKTYKKKSDAFKRLVPKEHDLLSLYSAIDDYPENPFKVTIPGIERQLSRIWSVLKDTHTKY